MPTRIAIRRRRSTSAVSLGSAAAVTFDRRLESFELSIAPPAPELPESTTLHQLSRIGGLIIDDDDEDRLDEAAGALDDEYIVMPDVRLTLPKATVATAIPLSASDALALGTMGTWDDRSGIGEAHAAGNRGEGVVVAILDTGCDADHAELVGRQIDFATVSMVGQQDPRPVRGFDPHGHGTHVTGIVAGQHTGIAPGVDLLVVHVIESETIGTSLHRIVRGLDWIVERADTLHPGKPLIVNLSLGFRPNAVAASDLALVMTGVQQLLLGLVDQGALPVVAIGNDKAGRVRTPGCLPEALAIGAVDSTLAPAEFSGGGPAPAPFQARLCPDAVGLGVGIVSSWERHSDGSSWYKVMEGTSMAAPYVSGIAALVAATTGLTGEPLRRHLLDTALPLSAAPDRVGSGLIRYSVP